MRTRAWGALLALVVAPLLIAQARPPTFQTPALSDSSNTAATTSFVQQLLTASTNATQALFGKLGITNVKWYGAACNGTTDDTASLASAATAAGAIRIPGGCTLRSGTTTIRAPLTIDRGGFLKVDSGATATIRSELTAPWTQVFNGAGSVVGLTVSRPVWWGAVSTYGNTFDSRAAIQAAINSSAAAFDAASPTDFSEGRRPTVEFGQGFYRACSPLDIYPRADKPITLLGAGIFNSGTRLEACSSFTGTGLIQVHGIASGQNGVHDWQVKGFNLANYTKASGVTAAIYTVPEGAGYGLNSGSAQGALVEDVLIGGFPIGMDLVNTLQVSFRRVTYQGLDQSNNTGVRIRTAGTGATANSGEFVFDYLQVDPCPTHQNPPSNSSRLCTNTTGVDISAGADLTSPCVRSDTVVCPSSAAIFFRNAEFWGSNTPLSMGAANGADVGDLWIKDSQFDGYSCSYIHAVADGAGSRIFNVHNDHNYHTGSQSVYCDIETWLSQNGGSIFNVWITNNHYVMGPTGIGINLSGVYGAVVMGNVLSGGNSSNSAITVGSNVTQSIIANNMVLGSTVSPQWTNGISIAASTDYLVVRNNMASGVSGAIISNNSTGTHNSVGP